MTKKIILTVSTAKNANSFAWFWRDKIINLVMPRDCINVKISLDLDVNFHESFDSGALTFHGKALNHAFGLFHGNFKCLIIDNDAFPLSKDAVNLTFEMLDKYGISGNLQRTNSIENGEHLFFAPSYLCVNTSEIHDLGVDAWVVNDRSDTAEEIVWRRYAGINLYGFRPYKNRFKPIWPLEGLEKSYGVGTYFKDPNSGLPISYHHFYSRIFIARIHFFFVSFFYYMGLKYNYAFCNLTSILRVLRNSPKNAYYFLVNSFNYFFRSNL